MLATDTHRWAQCRGAFRWLQTLTGGHSIGVAFCWLQTLTGGHSTGVLFAGYRHSQVGTVQGCFSVATDTHRWAQYRGALNAVERQIFFKAVHIRDNNLIKLATMPQTKTY